jgi:hypothetical protein
MTKIVFCNSYKLIENENSIVGRICYLYVFFILFFFASFVSLHEIY